MPPKMHRSPFLPHRLTLLALLVACAGAHAQTCSFRSAGSAINFPALDPSAATTATAFMDVDVRCVPGSLSPTFTFSGANGNAPLRMKHATQSAYIPYTVSPTRISGQGANETWRVTGTVLGANYENAPVGNYTDILSATITP